MENALKLHELGNSNVYLIKVGELNDLKSKLLRTLISGYVIRYLSPEKEK